MGVGGHPGARRRFGGLGGTEVGAEARTRGKLPQREVAGGRGGAAGGGGRALEPRERCWRGEEEEEESVAAAADAGGSGCGLWRREDAGDRDAASCGRRVDG